MRVLHVIDSVNPALGGPVEAVRQFAIAGSGSGMDVEVLTLDGDISEWRPMWPVKVHCVGPGYSSYGYTPRMPDWLRVHGGDYSGVVVHGLWKYHLPGVRRGLKGSGVPYFVMLHGMLNPWLKSTYPLKHLKKGLVWRGVVEPALRNARALLFLCERERELAGETFRLPETRGEILPLGLKPPDTDWLEAEPLFEANPELRGRRIVLFMARLSHVKGCDMMLDAFGRVCDRFPDASLVMAGPDHELVLEELKRRCRRLGLADRVCWPGALYGKMKWAALAASTVFALPSRMETYPVGMVEAACAGKPVLTTTAVNIHDVMDRWGGGVTVGPTVDELASGLGRLLAMTADELAGVGAKARRCYEGEFEIGLSVRRHNEIIARLGCSNGEMAAAPAA